MSATPWLENVDGRTLTSMKVGGTVRFLARPTSPEEIGECLTRSRDNGYPVRIIGGGSNLILADDGFEGLFIQPKFSGLRVLEDAEARGYEEALSAMEYSRAQAVARYEPSTGEGSQLRLVDEREPEGEVRLLEMGAGVPWGQAVSWSLQQGCVGLHRFARIPCHTGGAIYNNIHGGGHMVGEKVVGVYAYDPHEGREVFFGQRELELGYDRSIFHARRELVITRVVFALVAASPADVEKSKALYLEWTREKSRVQPSGANCGSVFQNLAPEIPREGPLAAAWYVEQCGFKGQSVGGMQVYPGHANFIINTGDGTQAQFIELVSAIRLSVAERFGFWLHPEAECMDRRGTMLRFESEGSGMTWEDVSV